MTTAVDQRIRMIPADTFANRLILVRAAAGHVSIREAAAKCGLGRGAWQNWERGGQPECYDDLVDLIAETFGIDREWLRNGGALSPAPARRVRWRRTDATFGYRRGPTKPANPPRPPSRPSVRHAPTGRGRTSRVSP